VCVFACLLFLRVCVCADFLSYLRTATATRADAAFWFYFILLVYHLKAAAALNAADSAHACRRPPRAAFCCLAKVRLWETHTHIYIHEIPLTA